MVARARNHGVRRRRVTRRFLGMVLLVALCLPRGMSAHPIHTTMSELAIQPDGSLTLHIRTFADDFSTAVARYVKKSAAANYAVSDSDATRYVGNAIQVVASDGRRVGWRFVSQRRAGDAVFLELRADAGHGLARATVLNLMLFEVHADQVNIVQASYGRVNHTTLFSRGDTPKTLP